LDGVDLLKDLDSRGLIHDTTPRDLLAARLAAGPIGVYYGCDPTADSLHVGHLIGLLALRRFGESGHRPFALAGGGTGMVGDPSGKSQERNLLSADDLAANLAGISSQIRRLVPTATFVDNAAWLGGTGLIEFLRDIGKLVTVNQMLGKESVRARLGVEAGLSFTEFSYMLLQGLDFYVLHRDHGCEMQIGGSDQWGNITIGLDIIRKRSGGHAHALTWPIMTRADGRKFGKTEDGTVWLSAARTSPYRFYQYWVNVDDVDAGRFLRQLTFLPLAEIERLAAKTVSAPEHREAQRVLAREVTAIVHGREAASAAEAASLLLFGGDAARAERSTLEVIADEVPTIHVPRSVFLAGTEVTHLLVLSGLSGSNSEARRSIQQGGVYLNNRRLTHAGAITTADMLHERYVLLRRGKSAFAVVVAD
jgi:tyrosyl-tRNA synthetase